MSVLCGCLVLGLLVVIKIYTTPKYIHTVSRLNWHQTWHYNRTVNRTKWISKKYCIKGTCTLFVCVCEDGWWSDIKSILDNFENLNFMFYWWNQCCQKKISNDTVSHGGWPVISKQIAIYKHNTNPWCCLLIPVRVWSTI